MALASFSAMFFLLILKLVEGEGRFCPKDFSCGRFGTMSYPFTESKNPHCGLFKIDCNTSLDFPRVELEGESYNATKKWDWVNSIDFTDPILGDLLAKNSCKTFDRNLSFPNSPSVSLGVYMNITLYKCMDNSNSKLIGDRFRGFKNHSGCGGFTIYYQNARTGTRSNSTGDVPANCSVIRLPWNASSLSEPNNTDVFGVLTSKFKLDWEVSQDCSECVIRGGLCQSNSQKFFVCSEGTSKRGHLRKTWFVIAAVTIFCCVGLLILLFCFWEKILWYKYLRFWDSNAEEHRNIEAFLENHGSYALKRYNFSDIKRITGHFKNKLGQGGYGYVYKGSLINGSLVAVKVLDGLKGSGEEFINEVASISKTSHVNVVSLVGFCFEGRKRALLYEFMPNGSLEKFIYDERSHTIRQLSWPVLYKIALGIARGLEYLHRGCNTRILHFDIKPHNILLDEDFCPKISDFGLAKLCTKKESIVSMLGARGTIGYIAPEIACRNLGSASHKSDVYSYGMMVLEMVGGRKNVDAGVDRTSEIYFPHWLYQRIELDEELKLIGIMNEEEKVCARKMVIMSIWCIQTDPYDRPSMSRVVEMLEGNHDSLQIPPKPYLYSLSRSEVDSSVIDSLQNPPKPYLYSPSGSEVDSSVVELS